MARVVRRRYLGGAAALVGGLVAAACGETDRAPMLVNPRPGRRGRRGRRAPRGRPGAQGAQGAQGATGAAAKPVRISFPDGWANYTMEKRLPVFEQENPSIAPIFEPNPEYQHEVGGGLCGRYASRYSRLRADGRRDVRLLGGKGRVDAARFLYLAG